MSRQTEVLFFFDTEDFTANRSADAIADLARICTSEGVIGHFALVGLLARQLVAWKRWDVLEALAGHDIGTHSYGHSLHPDLCEMTDRENFDLAYQALRQQETEALGMIRAVTSSDSIRFAVPPGNSLSYVAMYLYADLGIPFYADSVIADGRGSVFHYCNARHLEYVTSLESLFLGDHPPDLNELLDQYAQREQLIIYTHPNMAVHRLFWDQVNYRQTNLHPFGQWAACPERSRDETAAFYRQFRGLIRRLQADDRFRITSLRELQAREPARVSITPSGLQPIRQAWQLDFGPVRDPSLSIADVFCAVTEFLRGQSSYRPAKNHGFLTEPMGINATCTVSAAGLRKAAQSLDLDRFLPPQIYVDGQVLGPADFLIAGLDCLCTSAGTITLQPRPQLNSLQGLPRLADFKLRGTWLHSPDLADRYLSQRLRLQAWTLRYG